MSILGTIVSDISNAVSDPGKLVTDVVDAVVPERLKAIGDVAGGLVDVVVGKEKQAIAHFTDGLKDLPQLIGTLPAPDTTDGSVTAVAMQAAPPPSASSADGPTANKPQSVADLLALPSDEFMKEVSGGAVPAEVAQDPAALLQIQARVNDIAQMNQLVTSMMTAMHQMQMSIAQNIRA
jgi:hypothetical protein